MHFDCDTKGLAFSPIYPHFHCSILVHGLIEEGKVEGRLLIKLHVDAMSMQHALRGGCCKLPVL